MTKFSQALPEQKLPTPGIVQRLELFQRGIYIRRLPSWPSIASFALPTLTWEVPGNADTPSWNGMESSHAASRCGWLGGSLLTSEKTEGSA